MTPSPVPQFFAPVSNQDLSLIDVPQIGFDCKIGAELMCTDVMQCGRAKSGGDGEGNAVVTGNFGRIKENQLVDNARAERRTVKRGAGFQQYAEDLAAAKFFEYGLQIDSLSPS